jgi:hypothetical protein
MTKFTKHHRDMYRMKQPSFWGKYPAQIEQHLRAIHGMTVNQKINYRAVN